ncbi:MAG: hypothetical protein ACE5JU_25470, partial [Candidatus Binatia bacterium]
MGRIGRFSLLLAFLVLFAWAPVGAQSRLEKAKKEGKVVWYSSLTLKISQEVCSLFNSKNLGITCELHRSGSSKLYRRIRQEARGKIFRADVIHTSN